MLYSIKTEWFTSAPVGLRSKPSSIFMSPAFSSVLRLFKQKSAKSINFSDEIFLEGAWIVFEVNGLGLSIVENF